MKNTKDSEDSRVVVYLEMAGKLRMLRMKHGKDSKEENDLLDEMDRCWNKMSGSECQHVERSIKLFGW